MSKQTDMKTQNTNIATFLKSIYNVAYNVTNEFRTTSFRRWVYVNVEEGKLVLPDGLDEYDVYEAADRY